VEMKPGILPSATSGDQRNEATCLGSRCQNDYLARGMKMQSAAAMAHSCLREPPIPLQTFADPEAFIVQSLKPRVTFLFLS
jgi:hypothetical protein